LESLLPFTEVAGITPDLPIWIVLKTANACQNVIGYLGRRSIGEAMQHVDTDSGIRVAPHGKQPIPYGVYSPLDVTGTQVFDGDTSHLRIAVIGQPDQFLDLGIRRAVKAVGVGNTPTRATDYMVVLTHRAENDTADVVPASKRGQRPTAAAIGSPR
jgi:hypothetical protein